YNGGLSSHTSLFFLTGFFFFYTPDLARKSYIYIEMGAATTRHLSAASRRFSHNLFYKLVLQAQNPVKRNSLYFMVQVHIEIILKVSFTRRLSMVFIWVLKSDHNWHQCPR
ncbi:hypothetical protein L9F63_023304, partial [Diploptera punctata]